MVSPQRKRIACFFDDLKVHLVAYLLIKNSKKRNDAGARLKRIKLVPGSRVEKGNYFFTFFSKMIDGRIDII
jgi:hypothetical protein